MAQRIRAQVNPEVLVWARTQAYLSTEDAAKKAGVSIERLVSWETGLLQPTLRQARLLAKAYRRPSAFFYLATPPKDPPVPTDYRRLPDRFPEQDRDLAFEIRRAHYRREQALDLLSALGEQAPLFDLEVSLHDPPETVGRRLRDHLGIDMESQFGWRGAYEALAGWLAAVEAVGVLVFQFSGIEVVVARGFSIAELPLAVISINGKDAPQGRLFTLLHELCHIALGTSALCDLEDQDSEISAEPFCNAAAAAALVPANLLLEQPGVINHSDDPRWTDDALRTLGRQFGVSREVILRRLLTLGKTNLTEYQAKRNEFQQQRERYSSSGGFILYHKRVLRDNGTTFTSLVVSAYEQRLISAIDASRYLGDIRINHLPEIEYELLR